MVRLQRLSSAAAVSDAAAIRRAIARRMLEVVEGAMELSGGVLG
jgi:hypothetical protein